MAPPAELEQAGPGGRADEAGWLTRRLVMRDKAEREVVEISNEVNQLSVTCGWLYDGRN